MALIEKLTAIADAIRSKTGKTDGLTLEQMPGEIEGIQTGGGGDDVLHALLTRTLTEFSDDTITEIGEYAFYNWTSLKSLELPNATVLKNSALRGTGLSRISFPKVSTAQNWCFAECRKLVDVNLPELSTTSGRGLFQYCDSLEKVKLPKLIATSSHEMFLSCFSLKSVYLPSVKNIYEWTFEKCYSLIAIVLSGETVCNLMHTNNFSNAYHYLGTVNATYNPDGLKDGYIYVPRALVAEYQAATNWSTFASQFRALEDYTVDGTTTGELDPTKI